MGHSAPLRDMADFANNLRVGDKVLDVESGRNGLVSVVSEKRRLTKVILDGNTNAKTCDVTNLRLIVNGQPEDVAPFSGPLPEAGQPPKPGAPAYPAVRLVEVTPLESMEARRSAIKNRREVLQKEFVDLGKEDERLEQAIKVLKAV